MTLEHGVVGGWELELLEAEARDSEDDGVGKTCLPSPSQKKFVSRSHIGSLHGPLGTPSSKQFLYSIPDEQVHCNTKSDTTNLLSKANAEANEKPTDVQSGGAHSSKKCDLGSLLKNTSDTNKESAAKAKGVHLKEDIDHEGQEMANCQEGAVIDPFIEGKKRHTIAGMASVEEKIPTSAECASDVIGYARKTPRKIGAGNVMEAGRIETRSGCAQGNLTGEMPKEEMCNTPSLITKKGSNGLAQNNGGVCNRIDVENSMLGNLLEVKQHSDNNRGRTLDAYGQIETPLDSTRMQTCHESQPVDCDSRFKKVKRAYAGVDLPNISSKLDNTFGAENLVTPLHTEEKSTENFISTNSKFQHIAHDEASNLGNGNPTDCIDGNGEKTCASLRINEPQSSGIETPNRDCRLDSSANRKRQRQSKSNGSNKRKNTTPGSGLMSLGKKVLTESGEVNHEQEMHKMDLSVGKQSIDNGMAEIKAKIDNDFKVPSMLHTPGDLSFETPKSSTSLQSPLTNAASVSSLKVGRKQRVNRRKRAEKSPRLENESSACKVDGAELFDVNVPTVQGISSNAQADIGLDERDKGSSDLTSHAAQLKSDALDDNRLQPFDEGGIDAKGSTPKTVDSLDVLAEKHDDKASNKKPRKRGRPQSKKRKSADADAFDPLIKETEDRDNIEAAGIQVGGPVSAMGNPSHVLSEEKSDATPISKGLNHEASGSAKQLDCNNGFNSSPNTLNAERKSGNGSAHQCTYALSSNDNASMEMLQNLQVFEENERNQTLLTNDTQNEEMETPQTKVNKTVRVNQRSKKNKSGLSRGKKAKSRANIIDAAEAVASSGMKNSEDCFHDGKENTCTNGDTEANMKKSTKVSKRSRQGSHIVPSEEIKGVSEGAKLGSSKIVVCGEPRWFLLSGHRLQKKEFQQLVKSLGGRLCKDSHQWSYQATHLVVPEPLRRTEKFFAAAAAGRWILTTDYLTASKQAGRFLDEQEYEWHKSGLNEDGTISYEAPRKWRLLREKTGCGALHGLRIIVYGECIAPTLIAGIVLLYQNNYSPNKDTLKRVVKAGGGHILATCPSYNRFLAAGVDFAIISPGISRDDIWVQEFLRHNVACVLVDYIVEYVCKPSYPLDKHVLHNTHAAVEKSLKNLEMNIQSAAAIVESQRTPLLEIKAESKGDEEDKVEEQRACEISCSVCGSADRDDVMLLCGDGEGRGCGIAMHIDCCQPPLDTVPQEDWFCSACQPPVDLQKIPSAKKTRKA
eukprot:Gb_39610 [translate_table: standard]